MKLALMQPYYFPYVGYFDLAASCDVFVLYDDAAFSKNGWYNRNRVLSNSKPWEYVRVCVEKAPLGTPINALRLTSKDSDTRRTLALLQVYRRAPFYKDVLALLERVTLGSGVILSDVAGGSVTATCDRLGLTPEFRRSSELDYDRCGSAQEKVLSICRQVGASEYVNLSGGTELYDEAAFAEGGVRLRFTPKVDLQYSVGGFEFVPNLSILDVMMWLPADAIGEWLRARAELLW